MTESEKPARDMERDLEQMEKRSERLEQDIDAARDDWEAKKRDPAVPGAAGDPESAEREPPPETDYPSKGD
jgi:hypothetical protein